MNPRNSPDFDSRTYSLSQCNNRGQCTSEECYKEPACIDLKSVPTKRLPNTSEGDTEMKIDTLQERTEAEEYMPLEDTETEDDNRLEGIIAH